MMNSWARKKYNLQAPSLREPFFMEGEYMMFEIKVEAEFEAAHRIAGYPGKCDRLHGHSWRVQVRVVGRELDELGMLVDFKKIKSSLRELLETLDHRFLNELPPFSAGVNPTAENIARHIYDSLRECPVLQGKARLKCIEVWESPKSSVVYSEDE